MSVRRITRNRSSCASTPIYKYCPAIWKKERIFKSKKFHFWIVVLTAKGCGCTRRIDWCLPEYFDWLQCLLTVEYSLPLDSCRSEPYSDDEIFGTVLDQPLSLCQDCELRRIGLVSCHPVGLLASCSGAEYRFRSGVSNGGRPTGLTR